jgi:hypothetical protein
VLCIVRKIKNKKSPKNIYKKLWLQLLFLKVFLGKNCEAVLIYTGLFQFFDTVTAQLGSGI